MMRLLGLVVLAVLLSGCQTTYDSFRVSVGTHQGQAATIDLTLELLDGAGGTPEGDAGQRTYVLADGHMRYEEWRLRTGGHYRLTLVSGNVTQVEELHVCNVRSLFISFSGDRFEARAMRGDDDTWPDCEPQGTDDDVPLPTGPTSSPG